MTHPSLVNCSADVVNWLLSTTACMRFCTKRIDNISLVVINSCWMEKIARSYSNTERPKTGFDYWFTKENVCVEEKTNKPKKKKKKNSVCKFYEKIITGFILPDNLFDRIASKKGHGSIRLVFNWTRRCYSSVSVMFAVFAPKLPSTDSCEMVRSSILVSPL